MIARGEAPGPYPQNNPSPVRATQNPTPLASVLPPLQGLSSFCSLPRAALASLRLPWAISFRAISPLSLVGEPITSSSKPLGASDHPVYPLRINLNQRCCGMARGQLRCQREHLDETGTTGALHCVGLVADGLGGEGVPHGASVPGPAPRRCPLICKN